MPSRISTASGIRFPGVTLSRPAPFGVLSEHVENLPHILWRYGRTITALRYSLGRESSLPCSKSDLRRCLLAAIRIAGDGEARRKLCAGYVQLEAFVADAEFDAVRELLDRGNDRTDRTADPAAGEHSFHALRRLAALPEAAGTPAMAILTRVAERMLQRRHELGRDC